MNAIFWGGGGIFQEVNASGEDVLAFVSPLNTIDSWIAFIQELDSIHPQKFIVIIVPDIGHETS